MAEEPLASPSTSPEPVSTVETPASAGTTTTTESAPSSGDKGEPKKETLLEAVMRAVDPDADKGEPSTEPSPSTESADSPGTEPDGTPRPDLTKDPSPEELASYKKSTRERIERLLGERNLYRADAQVTDTLRNFLVMNDIAREDFQLTLDLAAAMRRGDFRAFLEGVGPYVELATQALGITLPVDLQNEVRAGRIAPDAAAQMSRDRYQRALADQRANRATQILTSQQTSAQQAQFSQSIEHTVQAWENGIRQSDPDYGRKEETVRNFLWSVVNEQGPPRSPEHAVEIAREAYNRANNLFRSFTPTPRATRPVPSSTNRSAAGNARSEPKSLMEAAMLGLERARAGS